ncbi:TRAP transporter large permease [Savagea faecisuis]|uniref:TRAP transporter large permease subunit n=1 Tax=Savagea faecisuis TaxID=1274803 RepID=A0ABW3GUP5_9BACL
MDAGLIGLLLFGALLVVMALGVPIAFGMSAVSIVFGLIFWGGSASLDAFNLGSYSKVLEFTLSAIPLYILMAAILQYSDIAEDLYDVVYKWLGGVRGGLAAGTTAISSIFAAMVGIATVATATLGMTARPAMLQKGYDDKLIMGTIIAGGALGILIPPSVLMIIYASEARVSAGAMFMGGVIPGALAAIVFIGYVLIISYKYPEKGPAIPKDQRFTWKEKFQSLRSVILPVSVILVVLGAIYGGLATPSEAAAIGVVGTMISAGIKKKLTFINMKKIVTMAVQLNAMVLWIVVGAVAYSRIVTVTGVGQWFADFILSFDTSPIMILLMMQVVFFILGMFIDPTAIILITGPLFLPVVTELGYDPVWYGVLFVINMCMAYMTPPFGFNLFVMRGVAKDVSIKTVYASVWPFVGMYAFILALVIVFPSLVLWLPSIMK